MIFSSVLTILFSLCLSSTLLLPNQEVSEYANWVEDGHGWSGKVRSLQSAEVPLGLLDDSSGVVTRCQIISQGTWCLPSLQQKH